MLVTRSHDPRSHLPLQSDALDAMTIPGDGMHCELCHEPLDKRLPYRRSTDGAGAHDGCLRERLGRKEQRT